MPHIAIAMYPGRDEALKQKLAEKLKAAAVEELKVDGKVVSVSLEEVPPEQWAENMKKVPANAMYIRSGS